MIQRNPTPGRENVTPVARELFRQMIDAREQAGIATYGTTLQTHNGRDVFRDLMEEIVDAWQYAVQAQMETTDLRADLDAANARAERAEAQRDRLLKAILDTDEPQKTPGYLRMMACLLEAEGHPLTAEFFDDLAAALDEIAKEIDDAT